VIFVRHHQTSLTSTQDACRALAEAGAPEGALVTADEQTAGRGRGGHTWYSPRGQAIYASILLRPSLGLRKATWLTMMAALAVRETIDCGGVAQTTIKWLNDIHLNGKKVCGILVETSLTGDKLDYAIVGIGLNVNTDFADAPDEVRTRATSLKQVFGIEFDRDSVLQTLLVRFRLRYAQLQRTQHSPAAEYAQHVETLGRQVRVQAGDEVIEGLAVGVDEWGALRVETSAGVRVVMVGQVH
jgi:BirA family biotin operon repressor/biotin-[acetyl-CoA-carboxylase] ligase